MVKKKTKAVRKKETSRKPVGVLHSVMSWVREKAGMSPYSAN